MSAIKAEIGFNKSHSRGLSTSTNASNPEKENEPFEFLPSLTKGKSRTSNHGPSPRKMLRTLSAADEVDAELAAEISRLSVSAEMSHFSEADKTVTTQTVIQPAREHERAHSSVPSEDNWEPNLQPTQGRTVSTALALNRYVSSSTTTGAASTLSGQSFVKHGQQGLRMTSIAPTDVPALPAQVGRMVYDPDRMMWVKQRDATSQFGSAEDSEDVFRNIESLSGESHAQDGDETRSTEGERKRHESFTQSTWTIGSGVDSLVEDDDDDSDDDEGPAPINFDLNFDYESDDTDFTYQPPEEDREEQSDQDSNHELEFSGDLEIIAQHSRRTESTESPPRPPQTNNNFQTPVSAHRKAAFIPRSVLKSGSATPQSAAFHRRSVSFSDGRKDGRIRGLHTDESGSPQFDNGPSASTGLPSARTRRIQARLEELEDTSKVINDGKRQYLTFGSIR
jgi:hypothetical protein